MKNSLKFILPLVLLSFVFHGCENRDENTVPKGIAVNNFIWKGLNLYYLWQADVPDLSDNRFQDQKQLNAFLYNYPSHETLFQDLLNKPISKFPLTEAVDRFSVIFSDYTILEGILSGTTKNNGADYALYYKDNTQTTVFGVVRYVLPNSDAAAKGVHRGDIFYAVDGTVLTKTNYRDLLKTDSYTLNLASYDSGNITPNGSSVLLNKSVLSENPVYINSVINSGSHKIGYLMYNGFYPNYESELNSAIGNLKSQGITELVLDLRYNPGGSIATATRLASMITGQFNGEVFAKEQWNDKLEAYYHATNASNLLNLFTNTINTGAAINSLNLSKVYVLTSKGTASASELVINGLEPYIDVIQIGEVTVGKNVGSITMYDSPTFSKTDVNPNHRYAMQPLVLKVLNKVGFGDYIHGLQPDDVVHEDFGNLGVLGNASEPLLNAAITRIVSGGRRFPQSQAQEFELLKDNTLQERLRNEMYLEKIPEGLHP